MEYRVWPRLDPSSAAKKFATLSLESGPSVDLDLSSVDFNSVGTRITLDELESIRDTLIDEAGEFGFRRRRGFDQEAVLDKDAGRLLDRQYGVLFKGLAPMRWAEAGNREVWSWISLCLLPDLTHWRWKSSVSAKNGTGGPEDWYMPRWIGSDLTRHTWSRYWWRAVQFEHDPQLLQELNEHEFNHFQERANSVGSNPRLMSALGRRLVSLDQEFRASANVTRRNVFNDSLKRLLRRMAFIDDASLDDDEIELFVDRFVLETRERLEVLDHQLTVIPDQK